MKQPMPINFSQAFREYWAGYSDFLGRTTRASYWWNQLWLFISTCLWLILVIITSITQTDAQINSDDLTSLDWICILWLLLAILVLTLPSCTLLVRRCRDVGVRGQGVLSLVIFLVIIWGGGFLKGLADFAVPLPQFAWLQMLIVKIIISIVSGGFILSLTVLPTDCLVLSAKQSRWLGFFFRTKLNASIRN